MIHTDLKDHSYLQPFVSNVSALAREYEAAALNLNELKHFFKDDEMPVVYSHFDYWVRESGFDTEDIGYDARGKKPVGAFPLFKKGFPIKWYDVNAHFPLTYSLLMKVPGIHFAQFSIMAPDAHILAHKHKVSDSRIFHINLFDLDGEAEFKAGNDTIHLKKRGDYFMFNPSDMHESANLSKSYRVHLMFDFRV